MKYHLVKYHPILLAIVFFVSALGMNSSPANAIRLADDTTHFINPPRLKEAFSSQDGNYVWGATYYFTLALPEDAGEPLQRVIILQEGGLGRPLFDTTNIAVFEGVRNRPGKKFSVHKATLDSIVPAITIEFDPPIPAGNTVTIRLYPVRNPSIAGTYLYGVIAFPPGEKARGQYIGVGQIRIYDSNLD